MLFDKWDLREGNDSFVFMERMVNDPSVKKVLIISDETYARKANDRQGGVGTETTIVSAEVYAQQEQSKFVVAIPPGSEDGRRHVPIYYNGKIYIDLSNEDRRGEEFERLVRWAFDKPLHVRPPLGQRPAYLDEDSESSIGTGGKLSVALNALSNGRSNAQGVTLDYLETFARNLTRFQLASEDLRDGAKSIINAIDRLEPARNELLQVLRAISRFMHEDTASLVLRKFLEALLPYVDDLSSIDGTHRWAADHYRFFVSEIYLIVVASLLEEEKFGTALSVLDHRYYRPNGADRGRSSGGYNDFRGFMECVDALDSELNKVSGRGFLLKKRADSASNSLNQLMQVELLLFLKGALHGDRHRNWWPDTLAYSNRTPMALFARAESAAYFERIKSLLGFDSADAFKKAIKELLMDHDRLPGFGVGRVDITALCGINSLASRP